jgi:hypothetical protein
MLFQVWKETRRTVEVETSEKGVYFTWEGCLFSCDGYVIYRKVGKYHLGKVKKISKMLCKAEHISELHTSNLNKARDHADNMIRSLQNE